MSSLRQQRSALLIALVVISLGVLTVFRAEASVTYGYDPSGRVTSALYDNGLCVVYVYDANGNRLSQVNYSPGPGPRPLWGAATWGGFRWSSAPQWPIWGSGAVWGCFKWTP